MKSIKKSFRLLVLGVLMIGIVFAYTTGVVSAETSFYELMSYQGNVKNVFVADAFEDRTAGNSNGDIGWYAEGNKRVCWYGNNNALIVETEDADGQITKVNQTTNRIRAVASPRFFADAKRLVVSWQMKNPTIVEGNTDWTGQHFYAGSTNKEFIKIEGNKGQTRASMTMPGSNASGAINLLNYGYKPGDWNRYDTEWVKVVDKDGKISTKLAYFALNGEIVPGTENIIYTSSVFDWWTKGSLTDMSSNGAGNVYYDNIIVYEPEDFNGTTVIKSSHEGAGIALDNTTITLDFNRPVKSQKSYNIQVMENGKNIVDTVERSESGKQLTLKLKNAALLENTNYSIEIGEGILDFLGDEVLVSKTNFSTRKTLFADYSLTKSVFAAGATVYVSTQEEDLQTFNMVITAWNEDEMLAIKIIPVEIKNTDGKKVIADTLTVSGEKEITRVESFVIDNCEDMILWTDIYSE